MRDCLTLLLVAYLVPVRAFRGNANLYTSETTPARPDTVTLKLLPSSLQQGGRCIDGTMAGYYFREGTDPSLFVIHMEGGGACADKESCTERSKTDYGSSSTWEKTVPATGTFSSSCAENPDFCNASAVYVRYCTGDCHSGNNTVASDITWGFYFDGHTNLAAIVDELEREHGLGVAKHVLLSAGSAGSVGAFTNIDWLASRLPKAVVKGAPVAGWFTPAALPDDPQQVPGAMPSDWAHFIAGTHGSSGNKSVEEFLVERIWESKGLLPAACIAAKKEDWVLCRSLDSLYRYIESPLYVIENQFDAHQLYKVELLPRGKTSNATEQTMINEYMRRYGEAMRNSTQQILEDVPIKKKRRPDGLFHPSCLKHMVAITDVLVQGQDWLTILGDWYFERDQLKQYHRLVESCPASAAGLPCNPACSYGPPTPGGGCKAALTADGCLPTPHTLHSCGKCALKHEADLRAAGCTPETVKALCEA